MAWHAGACCIHPSILVPYLDGGAELVGADLARLVWLQQQQQHEQWRRHAVRGAGNGQLRIWLRPGGSVASVGRTGSAMCDCCTAAPARTRAAARAQPSSANRTATLTLPPMATKASIVSASLLTGCMSLNFAITVQNCGATRRGGGRGGSGLRMPQQAPARPRAGHTAAALPRRTPPPHCRHRPPAGAAVAAAAALSLGGAAGISPHAAPSAEAVGTRLLDHHEQLFVCGVLSHSCKRGP
jgi:hypothetical protein